MSISCYFNFLEQLIAYKTIIEINQRHIANETLCCFIKMYSRNLSCTVEFVLDMLRAEAHGQAICKQKHPNR